MATNQHIIIDIGCLHCEGISNIVAVLNSSVRADLIAHKLNKVAAIQDNSIHKFMVFTLPETDKINPLYMRYLDGDE